MPIVLVLHAIRKTCLLCRVRTNDTTTMYPPLPPPSIFHVFSLIIPPDNSPAIAEFVEMRQVHRTKGSKLCTSSVTSPFARGRLCSAAPAATIVQQYTALVWHLRRRQTATLIADLARSRVVAGRWPLFTIGATFLHFSHWSGLGWIRMQDP